jgi:hypothetical protein
MRKFKNLFQIIAIVGVLFATNACSEDETLDELNQTIDKYEFNDSSDTNEDTKPPGNGGG